MPKQLKPRYRKSRVVRYAKKRLTAKERNREQKDSQRLHHFWIICRAKEALRKCWQTNKQQREKHKQEKKFGKPPLWEINREVYTWLPRLQRIRSGFQV